MLGKTYYKLSENLLNVLNTKNKEKDSVIPTHTILILIMIQSMRLASISRTKDIDLRNEPAVPKTDFLRGKWL